MIDYVFLITSFIICCLASIVFILLAAFRQLPTVFCVGMSLVFSINASFCIYSLRTENFRCPECNEWADYEYCEYCGTEINPMFVCPGCEREYDPKKVPDYCRECGELLAAGTEEEAAE